MKISFKKNDFLVYLITEKGDSEITKNCYEKDLDEFINQYNDPQIEDMCIEYYDDFLAYLMDKGYKRSTILRKLTTIRSFFIFLNKKKLLKTSIMQLETPKKEIRLPKYLTEKETTDLLKASSKSLLYYTMILFDLSTGLRVSELINIKYSDINLVDRFVKVKGKRDKERIVPFSSECLSKLNEYLSTKNIRHIKTLFTDEKNKIITRQKFYKKICELATEASINKKIGPHVLRHTYATRLVENGVKLRQVQILLGHSEIETTEIYTHIENKQVKSLYDEAIKR